MERCTEQPSSSPPELITQKRWVSGVIVIAARAASASSSVPISQGGSAPDRSRSLNVAGDGDGDGDAEADGVGVPDGDADGVGEGSGATGTMQYDRSVTRTSIASLASCASARLSKHWIRSPSAEFRQKPLAAGAGPSGDGEPVGCADGLAVARLLGHDLDPLQERLGLGAAGEALDLLAVAVQDADLGGL